MVDRFTVYLSNINSEILDYCSTIENEFNELTKKNIVFYMPINHLSNQLEIISELLLVIYPVKIDLRKKIKRTQIYIDWAQKHALNLIEMDESQKDEHIKRINAEIKSANQQFTSFVNNYAFLVFDG